jgi:hypothetical protein
MREWRIYELGERGMEAPFPVWLGPKRGCGVKGGVPVTFTGKGVAEKCSGFDDSGSRMAHKARMTSLEFCNKLEVMVSGKSVAVRINKGLQQCGRNCVWKRGQYHFTCAVPCSVS